MSSTTTRLPGWLVGSGVIAVAMGVMNVSTYAFTILAARLLGPSEYGALAAVMGLLLVVNVVSLGLQATGARRVSAAPEDMHHIEAQIMSTSRRSALGLALVCLLGVPVITYLLRLDSWMTAALIGVAVLPLTIMGGQAGILQGERRWGSLAAIYLTVGLGRVTFGVLAMLISPSALGAMLGVAVGAFAPVVVGWLAIRHPSRGQRHPSIGVPARGEEVRRSTEGLLLEVAHNSHALLAFFALSNADVVIARGVLDDHTSGLYAGGLILAKAVLFLPQFVVVIAFPSMSARDAGRSTHLKGLLLVLGIGIMATLGAALLAPFAILFIGGGAYAELEPLIWGFAAIGTVLAMIQVMVYTVVARQDQRSVFVVWAGLLMLGVLGPFCESVGSLLSAVLAVETCVLLVLVALSLRHPRPAPADPLTPPPAG